MLVVKYFQARQPRSILEASACAELFMEIEDVSIDFLREGKKRKKEKSTPLFFFFFKQPNACFYAVIVADVF